MNANAGTRPLVRLALRLDRVRLSVWVAVIALLPAATAAQYQKLYPTAADLAAVKQVISNPALVAIGGPLFGVSIGGLTAWKILATELVLVALMNIFTVVRHTRAEEESGRAELLAAGVVGRHAPLTAALTVTGGANAAVALLTALAMIGTKLPAAGSLALGLAIGVTGMLFAAITAVAAQITASPRTATGIAAAVLGASYLLRAVGDSGPTALSWMSPFGWALRTRSYAGERWWVLLLPLVLSGGLVAVAYALNARRDLGAGLVPPRPGAATAGTGLTSPFALAWRLQRGTLIAWTVGMAVWGAALGGAAKGLGTAKLDNKQLTDMIDRLGGVKGFVDAYLAAVLGISGLVVAAYAVQSTLRLRTEETGGRLEPVLATRVSRMRWAASHLAFPVLGTALLLAVTGVAAGLAYGGATHDIGGQVPRLLAGALVQLPATWVVACAGVALFGLAPRYSSAAWAVLGVCVVLFEVGALLGLAQWAIDLSPFAHAPKLPGSPFVAGPLVWLCVVAAALAAAGLSGFRRRDAAAG